MTGILSCLNALEECSTFKDELMGLDQNKGFHELLSRSKNPPLHIAILHRQCRGAELKDVLKHLSRIATLKILVKHDIAHLNKIAEGMIALPPSLTSLSMNSKNAGAYHVEGEFTVYDAINLLDSWLDTLASSQIRRLSVAGTAFS